MDGRKWSWPPIRIRKEFIAGLAAVCILGAFITVTSNKDVTEHAQILSKFERAKIADRDLNENILRLKSLILHSYEPLMRNLSELKTICYSLQSEQDYRILQTFQTGLALRSFCEELERKTALVERYKSDHSAFRTSNLELQILSSDLSKKLEALEKNYIEVYQARQSRALMFHYTLASFSVALVIWMAFLFERLNQTSAKLKDLNITLEEKVNRRTQQLSEALKKLKENHQLLMQTAKMTALGEMAGGIAHEINTPLAAINMNAGEVLENLNDLANANPEYLKKRLDSIIKIVERVSKIILGLRRFSRNTDATIRIQTPIRTIVEDTLSLCSEKLKAHSVQVVIDVPDHLSLNCTPEHISQVLLNFFNNSLDAMREYVPENTRWIHISAKSRKNGTLEISVTDAGLGISPEIQTKLMQPFFTTKPPGIGTGLGLSISKGIIEQHGGQLEYDAECTNTRFVMKFSNNSNSKGFGRRTRAPLTE